MDELELVRLHEDGDHLVVAAPDGAEHLLPVTDALRAAVRGDRPRLESIRAEEQLTMRPRDIQARLRAGATADELSSESGMPADQIRRFEYPVISEREHAVGRVRAKAVMSADGGTATIGDLADKRLRERGSDPSSIDWTATREGVAPWVVTCTFAVEAGGRVARWSFDPRGGAVIALDDEARWLALPEEDDGGPVSRTVTALPPTRGFGRKPAPADETDLLLDGLSERRGQRPPRGPEPAGFDAGELDLDELSPRRRRPESMPVARVRTPPTTEPGGGTAYGPTTPWGVPGTPADGDPSRGRTAPDEPGTPRTEPGAAGDGDPAAAEPAAYWSAPGAPGNEADGAGNDAPAGSAPADVVDLGARREKNGRPAPAGSLNFDAPSQWDIPGDHEERRPRTAALKTGGPLTGAVPKPVTGPNRSVPGERKDGGRGAATGANPAGHGSRNGPEAAVGDADGKPAKGDKKSRRASSRRGRAQVPSWDEIVFGSRPES